MIFRSDLSYEKFYKSTYQRELTLLNLKIFLVEKKTPEEAAKVLFEWVRDNVVWKIEKNLELKQKL